MSVPYGNLRPSDEKKIDPNNSILKFLHKVGGLSELENISFPSDEETKREIYSLKDRMDNITDEDYQFAKNAETKEKQMYADFARNTLGLNVSKDFIKNIMDKTDPILFYLKKHYNRGRPKQYADAMGIPFEVTIKSDAYHPSYPSGHAFDSYIMNHIFLKLRPDMKSKIEDFTQRMRDSRLNVGLHFPSDNVMSEKLARKVINIGLL